MYYILVKQLILCDILDGSKYDFEHSIPASMSFDNELKNLTIADKTYNQQIKQKRLPTVNVLIMKVTL
jgi:CRISPR-associated endonuclease Csn1